MTGPLLLLSLSLKRARTLLVATGLLLAALQVLDAAPPLAADQVIYRQCEPPAADGPKDLSDPPAADAQADAMPPARS